MSGYNLDTAGYQQLLKLMQKAYQDFPADAPKDAHDALATKLYQTIAMELRLQVKAEVEAEHNSTVKKKKAKAAVQATIELLLSAGAFGFFLSLLGGGLLELILAFGHAEDGSVDGGYHVIWVLCVSAMAAVSAWIFVYVSANQD